MLDSHYDPKIVEKGKYDFWKEQNYFKAGQEEKEKFSMVIPPPNVTGMLHLGHAWNTTIQDITARYKKAKGYDVLWLPGMDHAGIATQAKVEEKLRKQGLNRYELGRENFLKKVWQWKDEYASTIHDQWKMMGLSLDYSRERFTLDEGLNKAVNEVFISLYNKGLIYRGERIINWDPKLKTALSNIEVIHQDEEGKFYYFKYVLEDNSYIEVATTRPETMFGDTCVVVNPKDERYKHLIGKKVLNPANHEWIPIIGDFYVDMEFGTGAMKCTPAHDPNDYQIAKRHDLKMPIIMNDDATMNELCGIYKGLDRYECRNRLVKKIQEEGNLIKIENMIHNVGHSERSKVVIEPMLKKQWFIKMEPLAKFALDNQKTEGRVEFIPERFEKIFENWMESCEDWCISRQLWWGHRIPAYYHKITGEIVVSKTNPGDDYIQDEDVLDTWFSSALWPFSSLGWPENTKDLERYFPLDVMITAYDIIFFWVSRMIFQGLEFKHVVPFKKCLIHGLIRDKDGKKMSKSAGNGVDPRDVIDKYGVDALRYFLTTSTSPGMDVRYSEEKIQASQNYLNKIWNASRFILLNIENKEIAQSIEKDKLNILEKYILSKFQKCIDNVTYNMEKYEFANASTHLYNFMYDDFTSWYLELSKVSLKISDEEYNKIIRRVLLTVLKGIILMIYPYTPFIAEEIYLSLNEHKKSIMEEAYPEVNKELIDEESELIIQDLIDMIKDIRIFKVDNNLSPNQEVKLKLHLKDNRFYEFIPYLKRFSFANVIEIHEENLDGAKIYKYADLVIEEQIDVSEQKMRLEKEIEKLNQEIKRSQGMLNNPSFLAKAPEAKVALEKKKYEEYLAKLEAYKNQLSRLN